MKKIVSIKKLTDRKFLNLFEVVYKTDSGELKYEVASRKKVLDIEAEKLTADAVRIIPYFYDEDKKLKVVLIREFRYAINDYIYAVPAGLVDEDESPFEAAKRELEEEIGASVIGLKLTEGASYSSAGMSDESIMCYEAEVKLEKKQHLDKHEDISIGVVDLTQLENMLKTEKFCLQSRLQLRGFLYKQKYLEKIKTDSTQQAEK